jgi:hypothetical protein
LSGVAGVSEAQAERQHCRRNPDPARGEKDPPGVVEAAVIRKNEGGKV